MIRLRGSAPVARRFTPAAAPRIPAPRGRRGAPGRLERDPDRPAPQRALEPGEFGLVEFLPPVRPEAAVRGTGDRVFRDTQRGAKNRETKSKSGRSEAAVTMMPRAGMPARAFISGSKSQTSEAAGSSTSRSNRFFPVKTGVTPSARSRPGTGGMHARQARQENQG